MRLKVSHIPLFGEKRDTRFRSLSGAEMRLNFLSKALKNARNRLVFELKTTLKRRYKE